MAVEFSRLDHVGVVVRDLDASTSWYEEHFGFAKLSEYGFPGARVAFIGRGDLRIELFQMENAAPMDPGREDRATNLRFGGINHFAIGVSDIEAAVADLKAKGVEIVSPPGDVPDGRGDRYAFVRDNERMLIELFQAGK